MVGHGFFGYGQRSRFGWIVFRVGYTMCVQQLSNPRSSSALKFLCEEVHPGYFLSSQINSREVCFSAVDAILLVGRSSTVFISARSTLNSVEKFNFLILASRSKQTDV